LIVLLSFAEIVKKIFVLLPAYFHIANSTDMNTIFLARTRASPSPAMSLPVWSAKVE
jgi:hypothetical protein